MRGTRIDEKATIPLVWVFAGLAGMVSVVVVGTFWVSMVDFRLERIEQKLSIPTYHSEAISLWSSAFAKGHPRDDSK